jgi:hypothetical protein
VKKYPAQNPTRPSFITPFGLAVEACSEIPETISGILGVLRARAGRLGLDDEPKHV